MQNNRILFTVIAEKGHINPMIGIAQALQEEGFKLAFFTELNTIEQLKKADLNANIYVDSSRAHMEKKFATRGKSFVEKLANKNWLFEWIKSLLIEPVPLQVDMIEAVIKDFNPSLIVSDPMIYSTPIAAHLYRLPWVGISSSLNPLTPSSWECDLTETIKALDSERRSLFEKYNFSPEFKISDAISPWLNIVFSTEDYTPRHLSENHFSFYSGHCFPSQPRGDETDFPFHLLRSESKKVYMSLGSQIYYFPQLFSAVAEALSDDHFQLIFSINELIRTDLPKSFPKNVISVSYAPQLELLKQVHLTISHGGANSVLESLAHGIPVAILPICNDQFLQAQFITRANTGIVLDPLNPNPEIYRKQLLPLLETESIVRKNAQKIGVSFSNYDGSHQAAALIKELHKTRKPMMPT